MTLVNDAVSDGEENTRMIGTIARKNDRGYCFILPRDGSPNIFLHASALPVGDFDLIAEGEALQFEIEIAEDGRRRAVRASRILDGSA